MVNVADCRRKRGLFNPGGAAKASAVSRSQRVKEREAPENIETRLVTGTSTQPVGLAITATNSGYGCDGCVRYLSGPESLIHLTKIVSNTQPTAAHAATRMCQRTRMPNWYLVSLSFMAGC